MGQRVKGPACAAGTGSTADTNKRSAVQPRFAMLPDTPLLLGRLCPALQECRRVMANAEQLHT
jgi:hypothetical protein